jgi:hypothetical protein
MKSRMWLVGAVVVGSTCISRGGDAPALEKSVVDESTSAAKSVIDAPVLLSLAPEPESVYAPPAPPREDEGINQGGANIDVHARYLTDYIYRGVDRSNVSKHDRDLNLQVDGKLSFNLGKFPHPSIGLFANVFDSDPVSHIQEVRPFFGFDWTIRPFILTFGNNTYVYPERDHFGTSEVYGQVTFDDSILWHSEKPIFSPYVYAAYDYDKNHGWYFEGGIKHDFYFEDYGITVTPSADVAAIQQYASQFIFTSRQDSGFQHYDVGLTAAYSLNKLFNFPKRYGDFALEGYVYYTGSIGQHILADNQLWGGAGIAFHY